MAELLASLRLVDGEPVREQIEAAIEHLIALLDAADGDPDFEVEDDEADSDFEPEEDLAVDDWPCDGDEGV